MEAYFSIYIDGKKRNMETPYKFSFIWAIQRHLNICSAGTTLPMRMKFLLKKSKAREQNPILSR